MLQSAKNTALFQLWHFGYDGERERETERATEREKETESERERLTVVMAAGNLEGPGTWTVNPSTGSWLCWARRALGPL